MSGSSVSEFYRDRALLITGATGFMGKVLVEKLLRSCSSLSTIYLLMRPKGQQDVAARLQDLLSSKVRYHHHTRGNTRQQVSKQSRLILHQKIQAMFTQLQFYSFWSRHVYLALVLHYQVQAMFIQRQFYTFLLRSNLQHIFILIQFYIFILRLSQYIFVFDTYKIFNILYKLNIFMFRTN